MLNRMVSSCSTFEYAVKVAEFRLNSLIARALCLGRRCGLG